MCFVSSVLLGLYCYTLVKDLRTDYETSNLDDVMNGNLQGFILEYLKWNK